MDPSNAPKSDPPLMWNLGAFFGHIVQAIRDQKLPLAKFIVDEFTSFDPAHPDDPLTFAIPASPNFSNQRPLGDEAK